MAEAPISHATNSGAVLIRIEAHDLPVRSCGDQAFSARSLGNTPTTSVRRLISWWRRSSGLEVPVHRRDGAHGASSDRLGRLPGRGAPPCLRDCRVPTYGIAGEGWGLPAPRCKTGSLSGTRRY